MREIARRLGRHASTIRRELARNCLNRRAARPLPGPLGPGPRRGTGPAAQAAKLAVHPLLRAYVQQASSSDGWSPEQITRRLLEDFPDDEAMRISHETIYQSLYVQGRGALRRELTACLRTGRALRKPRRRADGRGHAGSRTW